MSEVDLRTWLKRVDEMGELRKVDGATAEEDIGMATELLHHTKDSSAAIFDNIPGYKPGYRVLVNSFGSLRRIALSLGLPTDLPTQDLIAAWRNKVAALKPIPPVFVNDGPVLENVQMGDDVNVLQFPTPKWHEADGGRYIGTGSADITVEPDAGWTNLGTYRVMVHDAKRVGFYISPGKHGRIHREKYFSRGEPCPVAVAIGLPPALYLAACTEITPYAMSEYDWAGGLTGQPMKVFKGRVTGLTLPAEAEIILEGYATENNKLLEGPFGEWTGYYASASREEPVIDVKAIYYQNNPIIVGSPPNRPPDEQSRYRAFVRSVALLEDVQKAGVPDVTGVWCHEVGGARLLVGISIKQRYPGHARQAGHIAAMCHSGAYLGRYVVVVDDDIDVSNLEELMWAMCSRADPAGAIDIINRAWSGPLDPAIHPDHKGFNSRAVIDACRPYEWRDKFPAVNEPTPEVKRKTREKWGYLIK